MKLIQLIFPFVALCISFVVNAQKHCNFSLEVHAPTNNSIFYLGDTAIIVTKLTNHGPDNFTDQDTLAYFNSTFNYYRPFYKNLAVGESFLDTIMTAWADDAMIDTFGSCLYFDTSLSVGFLDTIRDNDTSCFFIILNGIDDVAINDISKLNPLRIYPNPSQNYINLTIPEITFSIQIYNLLGQSVQQQNISSSKIGEDLAIDIRSLTPGIYILKLRSSNKTYCTPFRKS
jgi:hypothetical protein